ncbi:MAG: 16S rRNA (cytidine(1402)-2'-O)-methyltransferase [Proteobacteria bacterium]|nr:16S rRNA (cytidine(1402)-2'-O)-methyltransferase [Pseudomonadota bacterium]
MRPDSPLPPPPDFPCLLFWSSSILNLPAASASLFRTALQAARDAAGSQDYPQGTLYVVATPIGNLADVTLRALHVLDMADAIACEDTRHTQSMLRAYGIDRKGGTQLLAVHQHNESEAAQSVIGRLAQGERIAYVSDAGTPGVSDPGARLAAAVRAAGHRVLPLPGASSVITLISAAGLVAADADDYSAFVFTGFLPSKATERDSAVARLAAEPRAVVLLEAPHRIEALARALAALGTRRITVGRELTKQFEEIDTVPCDGLAAWLGAKDHQRTRGEFALVLHPQPAGGDAAADEGERILQLLLAELPVKTAVRLAAEISGAPRNALYQRALELRRESDEGA